MPGLNVLVSENDSLSYNIGRLSLSLRHLKLSFYHYRRTFYSLWMKVEIHYLIVHPYDGLFLKSWSFWRFFPYFLQVCELIFLPSTTSD